MDNMLSHLMHMVSELACCLMPFHWSVSVAEVLDLGYCLIHVGREFHACNWNILLFVTCRDNLGRGTMVLFSFEELCTLTQQKARADVNS